jgi:hypothetical protein
VLLHVRECGHDLVLGGQLSALLELEITNGTRQGKVAVDTTKVDKAAGSSNSVLLLFKLRLVILRQRQGAALDAQDGSRITGVGLVERISEVCSAGVC